MTVLGGWPVPYYASRVREDVQIMATTYREPEIGALTGHFLDHQPADGIIFDYFRPVREFPERPRGFEPRHIYHDEADGMRYDRLPVVAARRSAGGKPPASPAPPALSHCGTRHRSRSTA